MVTHAQHCSHMVPGDGVLLGQHVSPSLHVDTQQTHSAYESWSHLRDCEVMPSSLLPGSFVHY